MPYLKERMKVVVGDLAKSQIVPEERGEGYCLP